MRTIFSIVIVSFFFSSGVFAQNPTRKVLYTLGENEFLYHNEFFVTIHESDYKYALVLEDIDTQKLTLDFNGKRIPFGYIVDKSNGESYVLPSSDNWFAYVDLTDPEGYVLHYSIKNDESDKEEYWVNRGGKIEGPYEYVWSDISDIDGTWKSTSKTYHYVLADRVYDNVEGKINPSKDIFSMPGVYAHAVYNEPMNENTYISVNGTIKKFPRVKYDDYIFGEVTVAGNNYIINTVEGLYLNGNKISSRPDIHDVQLNHNGDYVYKYSVAQPSADSNKCWYIVKNGVILNTDCYQSVKYLYLTTNGDVAYIHDNKIHMPDVADDIAIEGPVDGFIYLEDNQYAYSYSDGKGSWYIKTDKAQFGPYGLIVANPSEASLVYDGNRYAFNYFKNGNWYVKTNKTEFGPYNKPVRKIEFVGNDDCWFYIDHYKYRNGKLDQDESNNSIEVNGHNFYSSDNYDYVIIDGRRFGKSAPFEYKYDKSRNAFVWYCIEDRDIVVYEYALNF